MSLTSYRAAPPRGSGCRDRERCFVGFSGLAATYSPASWDAVPSARRRLTAEFGMGSGVSLALGPPNLESPREPGLGLWRAWYGRLETVFSDDTDGFCDFRRVTGLPCFRIG